MEPSDAIAESDYMRAIADNLRDIMDLKGVSVKQLARRTGISESSIYNYLHGSCTLTTYRAMLISQGLGVHMTKLLDVGRKMRNMNDHGPRRNAEGYSDGTPYEAVRNVESEKRERRRIDRLMQNLRYVCELAGFDIVGRVILKDRSTGKTWR